MIVRLLINELKMFFSPFSSKKKKLIVLSGPTGVGKTEVSIFLAKKLNIEIVSFDSRQFYKELKIGASPPSIVQLNEVKHHFIGHLSIHESYNVGEYKKEASLKIKKLFQKYSSILMVGGSGLYEKAITEGLDEFPKISQEIRQKLERDYQKKGITYLQEELKSLDLDYYKEVDLKNPRRLIRALEIIFTTGKKFSGFLNQKDKNENDFEIFKIGLHLPREELYERINKRVDAMLENGLLNEAKSLFSFKNLNALQTVGYKELFAYLENKIFLERAIEEIKKNTRRYAKRQMTWFRKDKSIKWFLSNEKKKIIDFLNKNLQ